MRRRAEFLTAHASRLVVVGIACSLAVAVALQWDAIRTFDWQLSWLPFLGAVCLFSLGPLAGAMSFWLLLRDLSPGARFGAALQIWGRSFAARYIPSGAMTVAVRMVERERLGASRAQMVSATAYEQIVAAAAAAGVSLLAFSLAGERPPVVALVVLGAVLALAGVAQPAVRWWSRQRELASLLIRARVLVSALVLCGSSWLVAGCAAWIFIGALAAVDTPSFAFLLGAYTFAWLVGFVTPIAPSGLGVREATLVALLGPSLGIGPATALTVGLRLANVAGDFLAIGAMELSTRLARRWRRAPCTGLVGLRTP